MTSGCWFTMNWKMKKFIPFVCGIHRTKLLFFCVNVCIDYILAFKESFEAKLSTNIIGAYMVIEGISVPTILSSYYL